MSASRSERRDTRAASTRWAVVLRVVTLLAAWQSRHELAPLLEALSRTTVVARGPKPLKALKDAGVRVAVTVPEPNTWRDLLAAVDEAGIPLRGARVVVQEYGVPNQDLHRGLEARGALVTPVPVVSVGSVTLKLALAPVLVPSVTPSETLDCAARGTSVAVVVPAANVAVAPDAGAVREANTDGLGRDTPVAPRVTSLRRSMSTPTALPPPDKLGGFEIIRRLGSGGMAELFVAKKRGAEGAAKASKLSKSLIHIKYQTRANPLIH